MLMLFLKAKLAGNNPDLFAETVQVSGYTNQEGKYVAPHTSTRLKRHDAPAAPDLFSQPAPAPAAPKPKVESGWVEAHAARAKARKEMAEHLAAANSPVRFSGKNGEKYLAGPDVSNPGMFRLTAFDDDGPSGHSEFTTLYVAIEHALREGHEPEKPESATPVEAESVKAPPAPSANDPVMDDGPALVEGAPLPAGPAPVMEWGVPAGVSKKERKALNQQAVDLLNSKHDTAMTADDKQVLARYSGTGGIGDSLNEFYTDPAVASAMWSMLENAGFSGGEVLEPSCGTGVFLHTAPKRTHVYGVEIDPTSAKIANILHRTQGHQVSAASLERFATQDGRLFDAVIGNVPFGVRGSTVSDDKPDMATCERYFFDTALDKTKDLGLVALIVPTGIMDSKTGRSFREKMLAKGEFLGAWRLPNTAFEAGHTEVTSDIVLFRKRPQAIAGALGSLNQQQKITMGEEVPGIWDEHFLSGTYFTEGNGPPHIMGKMEEGWRAKAGMGDDITVTGSMDGVAAALGQEHPAPEVAQPSKLDMARILSAVGDDEKARDRVIGASLRTPYQTAKIGDTKTENGVLYVLQGDPPRWHRAEQDTPEAVLDAIKIGTDIDALSRDEHASPSARADLALALDNYVRLHGLPQGNKQLAAWLKAPSLPMKPGVSEEEHGERVSRLHRNAAQSLGAVRNDGTYSDLITGAKNEASATLEQVALQLALENGGFSPEELQVAYGHSDLEAIKDYLFASPEFAIEADGKRWTTLDEYLSGSMWPKLDGAREAALHEGIGPEYRRKYEGQIDALEKAIDPQSLESVEVMVNSGFVKPEILTAWLHGKAAKWRADNPDSKYEGVSPYTVTFKDGIYNVRSPKDNSEARWGDAALLSKYLNRTGVKKDEIDDVAALNASFREWLLGSEYRDEVEELYNRTYRGYRPRAYSTKPFDIPGLTPDFKINDYHFSGLRWALEAGKGIIAADVGLGKTGRALMLAKLAKITGKAKCPTIVVPKSVLANWMQECQNWFPGSKVMVIGETYKDDGKGNVTSKSDDEATRRQKFQALKQNDYDFVLISQPAWNELDVDPITKGQYINSDFWVQRGDSLGNAGDKRVNAIREAYNQAVAKRDFQSRENTLYFGDTGIDMLIFDEGHHYKNLVAARNRFGMNPKFLGGSGQSNRAQDTYFKARQLREKTGGKGVYMLTATPTKNSPLEIFSMLQHVAPEAFERMGIMNSEMFIDRFCEFKNDLIANLQGGIEEALVTAGFKNLGELREVMGRFIDRKTAADVGLVLPVAHPSTHFVDMTEEQKGAYQVLRERALMSKSDATGAAHIFSIMSDMGKASIDLSLLSGKFAKGSQMPKVDACVKVAVENSKEGGQIIFCDHVGMHEKIADALVRSGILRGQIGIINADVAKASAARQKTADSFNAGKLKFVIGNTATMGEGINLQKGTTDIHHLDLPWEPASMQQRNGRGLRQGNTKEGVRLHTYLAKGSFDGYRFQTIAAKKDWQDLLWNGGDKVENLAREGGFSRADMLIMLSANPEEARAKYEADKTAAEQRQTATGRADAILEYGKLAEMRNSAMQLAKLGKGNTPAAIRLSRRISVIGDSLRANRYFPPKHILDQDKPALIEPTSMHPYQEGSAFELAPGKDGPIHWSDDRASKWVVTGVDTSDGTLSVRLWGSPSAQSYSASIGNMKAGVTPFEYDSKAEQEAIKKSVASLANAKAAPVSFQDIMKLPPELLRENKEQIQENMKEALRTYKMSPPAWVALEDAAGTLHPTPSYVLRDALNEKSLVLPTPENKERIIQAYLDSEHGKTYSSRLVTHRRKTEEQGIEGNYGISGDAARFGAPHENPYRTILQSAFGETAAAEAERKLAGEVRERIKAAPTFGDAVEAAAGQVAPYGRDAGALWPPAVAATLYGKAKALGVLDKRLSEEVIGRTGKYKKRLHDLMFSAGSYKNYARDGNATIGQFLRHLEEKNPGKNFAEMAAAEEADNG